MVIKMKTEKDRVKTYEKKGYQYLSSDRCDSCFHEGLYFNPKSGFVFCSECGSRQTV